MKYENLLDVIERTDTIVKANGDKYAIVEINDCIKFNGLFKKPKRERKVKVVKLIQLDK